jgi:hypothetical protein
MCQCHSADFHETLHRQNFYYKNTCTEFNENPTDGLVTDIKSQKDTRTDGRT